MNHVSWRYSHSDFDFVIPTIETDPRSDLKSPYPNPITNTFEKLKYYKHFQRAYFTDSKAAYPF